MESPSVWLKQKQLFQSLMGLSPDERNAYFASTTVEESIRLGAQQMLELHDASGAFLCSPVGGDAKSDTEENKKFFGSIVGQQPGGYRIETLLGSGGNGAVYLARQSNPNRHVAIKLLNTGFHLANQVRRFEHEIEILARLDHPGIAKIYSAGVHDFGRGAQPWYAMEYVDGSTLCVCLRQSQPTVEQKVRLLIQVCEAVQHANERGIVHRDLKPSNILIPRSFINVSEINPDAMPKVVDFGIARILDDNKSDATLTREGELLGTLNYMSPEQLSGTASTDQRSDVFALGMIGFEMIAGKLAFERAGCSIAEVILNSRTESPTRLRHVYKHFDRDLECILYKALEPDANRRFSSAQKLAEDLKRYLNGDRILARPPHWFYLTRKFVSKNRALVTGTVATMIALLIGLGLYARSNHQVRLEADKFRYEAEKSQAINDFVTNDFMVKLIAAASDNSTLETDRIRTLVQQAASHVDTMFADRPLIEAAIRNEIGTIYFNLREMEDAATQFEKAQLLWRSTLDDQHRDVLKAKNNLGQAYLNMGKHDLAEPLLKFAFESRQKVLGPNDAATIISMNELAEVYRQTGRTQQAMDMLRELISIQQSQGLKADKTTIAAKINLGTLLIGMDRVHDAVELHVESFELAKEKYGTDHPMTLNVGMRTTQTLQRAGKLDEADEMLAPILDRFANTNGLDHATTISARRLMARILKSRNDKPKAREQLRLAESALTSSRRDPELLKKIQTELKALGPERSQAPEP